MFFSKIVGSLAGRRSGITSVAAGSDPGEDVNPVPDSGEFRFSLLGFTNSFLTPNHKENTKKLIHILLKQSSAVYPEQ